jgi:hypothetical protein
MQNQVGFTMRNDTKFWKFVFTQLFVIATLISISGCNSEISKKTEIMYKFDVRGNDCKGINYGWLSEEGVNQSCHDFFTKGDVRMDCPTPKTVSIIIESPKDPGSYINVSSYISVSSSSICIAHCQIWISGEFVTSDDAITIENDHIASCNSRVH